MGDKSYGAFEEIQQKRRIDLEVVKQRLKAQKVETPSWGYSNSGTRFGVFEQRAAARDVFERLEDAAEVHRLTGITPSVALHIPWDYVDDWQEVCQYAAGLGLKIGAINPNLFEDQDYKLGSITHPDEGVREKAVSHMLECVDIMRETNSTVLSCWFADGTNYPGQDDFRARRHRAEECLSRVYDALNPEMRMLLEYKFFEPAFYHTDFCDWGTATLMAKRLGDQAQTLVDLGHHPLGANVEHIVALLIDEGKLGGFHFNCKKYADDDLTTGSIAPYQLFLIFTELVKAENDPDLQPDVAYMIDQSHNIKPKVEAMVQSVQSIQTAYAKALLVDYTALVAAQAEGDVVMAEELLKEAFQTDVRPLLTRVRAEMGVPVNPLQALREGGYIRKKAEVRGDTD